ncbi:Caffeoylshikimate esterase [Linum perenne]
MQAYEVNSRGIEIFTKRWVVENPKALVCYCHGYGDTCTFFFEGIARKLALSGYSVLAMDYPGFGLSEGLHGYVSSFDALVDDVIEHYDKVKGDPEFRNLPSFLFGQSMGGAVALKVHLKQPNAWSGAILVAPMCKIADDMAPPWVVKQFLIGIASFLPKQKLVPQKDIADAAFRDLKKREMVSCMIVNTLHSSMAGGVQCHCLQSEAAVKDCIRDAENDSRDRTTAGRGISADVDNARGCGYCDGPIGEQVLVRESKELGQSTQDVQRCLPFAVGGRA